MTRVSTMHFEAEGSQPSADIRSQLEKLRTSGLPIDQLQTQIEALNQQLKLVLLTDLVPAGNSADTGGSSSAQAGGGTDTTPATTGTETGTTASTTDTNPHTTTTATTTETSTAATT